MVGRVGSTGGPHCSSVNGFVYVLCDAYMICGRGAGVANVTCGGVPQGNWGCWLGSGGGGGGSIGCVDANPEGGTGGGVVDPDGFCLGGGGVDSDRCQGA